MDKIMKEKDKLEMQAMVIRMQERDAKKVEKTAESKIIESQN